MPYLYHDDDKRRWYMSRKVPKDLHAILGRKFLMHKFSQSVDETEANDQSLLIGHRWDGEIARARGLLPKPSILGALIELADRLKRGEIPKVMQVLEPGETMRAGAIDPAHVSPETIAFLRRQYEALGARLWEFEPRPTKVVPCTTEEAIAMWKIKRGDDQPKQPAIDSRRSKMAKFFAFIRKPDDLSGVTWQDIQSYKDHLVEAHRAPSNIPYDHLVDVVALFNVADENHRFKGLPDGNPAKDIVLPPKREGASRKPFTEIEARRILLAARNHEAAIIRWGQPLQCYLGAIVSEISDALVSHIRQIDGVWCFDLTPEGRVAIADGVKIAANLKTAFRPRCVPLHQRGLINAGFLDYVEAVRREYGDDAPLFPDLRPDKAGQRNTRASDMIMEFLRSPEVGIVNEVDPANGRLKVIRDSYCWRKRFATMLEDMPGLKPDRQRYLTGHAAPDIHGRRYLDHPPRKLKRFIEALCDPTIRSPQTAAA
jgi:integrase